MRSLVLMAVTLLVASTAGADAAAGAAEASEGFFSSLPTVVKVAGAAGGAVVAWLVVRRFRG